ncbi:AAA family ATPase [Sorangium sp. So ce204]|uniref:AAA family ATPase n=1 Tax=Sorangium sp. So ce204 TaxID=3133288 RepID=UPI003F619754
MKLVGFGVKNLRCLTDTGILSLKPITLLVGRNSSGKSTFLRAFPLLRQSVEAERSSPILWYDPKFVDFGSVADAVNFRSDEKCISFCFCVDISKEHWWTTESTSINVEITIASNMQEPYVNSCKFHVADHEIIIRAMPDGQLIEFLVDSHNIMSADVPLALGGRMVLIPALVSSEGPNFRYVPVYRLRWEDDDFYDGRALESSVFYSRAESVFLEAFGSKAPASLVDHVRIGSCAQMLNDARKFLAKIGSEDLAIELNPDSPGLRRGLAFQVAYLLPGIIANLDYTIGSFFAGIRYVAPLRASALRTYRIQQLSVQEIDPQGQNLPMFLRSLSPEETRSFAAFTRAHLGFETMMRTERLHTEILIKERGADRFVNLVDAGFGYSEILPLAATLWSACLREQEPGDVPTTMLAIEQPELHLHPAHQARLADMIVGALLESRRSGREVKLMVETHSEALVNGLGMLIRKKQIDPSDAQILFFDQDRETRQTTVTVSGYEEDGALSDSWPFGFLAPVAEPLEELPIAVGQR